MNINYKTFWATTFFCLILSSITVAQTITADTVKSHKLATPAKVLTPSISLKPSGKKLFVEIKPPPATIEVYSDKRRLATIRGNNRTRFDITRYKASASNGRLLVIVKDKSGKPHRKNLNIARSSKTTSADKHNQAPRASSRLYPPPERENRMTPGSAGNAALEKPRASSDASPSGNRPSQSNSMMRRLPASRQATQENARITSIVPQPALIGKNFTIHGDHFGPSRGTATLKAAGLTLRPSIRDWSDTSVQLVVPEGLEPLVGYDNINGRVWLYPENKQSVATSQLVIAPDPETLSPLIHNAPLSVEPGDEITITGEQFLMPAGTVSLSCPGGGISTRVESWSENRIQVKPAASLSRPVESNDCSLVVTNHRGMETRRGIYLNVILGTKELTLRNRHNFSDGRFVSNLVDLANGWVIVDSSYEIIPKSGDFSWDNRPPSGGRTLRGSIHGTGNNDRIILLKFTVEGPAKLDPLEGAESRPVR